MAGRFVSVASLGSFHRFRPSWLSTEEATGDLHSRLGKEILSSPHTRPPRYPKQR